MAQQITAQDLRSKMAEILDSWPLYRRFQWITIPASTLPPLVEMFCEQCEHRQWHALSKHSFDGHGNQFSCDGETSHKTYLCKNCSLGEYHFLLDWRVDTKAKTSSFMKIGQWPSLEEDIPEILQRNLSDGDLELYRKAIRSRNNNFGLAAMAYLRRVVENRMNEVLDLISGELEQSPADKFKLEEVKLSWQFSKKVDYAAGIVPKSLKPGGMNPIDVLHDVASDGLHNLPEDDCINLFDKARTVFEFVYRELQIKREDALKFALTMRELSERKRPAE